ncbi:MAG: hypothetical protein ACYCU6_12880, partial [Acidimicrobiales bacterium]
MPDPGHGPSAADRLERGERSGDGRGDAPGSSGDGTDPLAGQPAPPGAATPRRGGAGAGPPAPPSMTPPAAIPGDSGAAYPESFRYRLKDKLRGGPGGSQ